ncbi:MAG: redoxin domain-containing protein [Prevotellaceae bacterium]|jgi:peroxiredoxin|nr:redoxin domain-containing protein [Prevotellaceae bacterium]
MKKIIIVLVLFSAVCTIVYFLKKSEQRLQKIQEISQKIPVFSLPDINGKIVSNDTLRKNTATLFLFFEPECDNCRYEFEQINLQKNAFADYQIVFFTNQSAEIVKQFLADVNFIVTENMFFVADTNNDLINKMEVKASPAVYIYNKKENLTKKFNGIVKTETLLKYLSEK